MAEDLDKSVIKSVRPQNKHLTPFKKGQVTPGAGRPEGQRNYATIYREALIKLGNLNGKTPDELENELVASGFVKAKKDFRFYKDVLDRTHGTAVNKSDMTTNGKDLPTPIYNGQAALSIKPETK